MEEADRSVPREQDTADAADLPVEAVPRDAPTQPYAASDAPAPGRPDPAATAGEPDAHRDPRALMDAYAAALADGDAGLAAGLFAEAGTVAFGAGGGSVSGRQAVAAWHRELLGRGAVRVVPAAQGNDTGRLELRTPDGDRVVELSFDAAGRIGTARWLTPAEQRRPQDERERRAL
jgi:SnoaL-like domain